MNNTSKVGLLAGMMMLAVLTVSGSASAHAAAYVHYDDGSGDQAPSNGCTGLFPVWDCAFAYAEGYGSYAMMWVEAIRCNYIGGPVC